MHHPQPSPAAQGFEYCDCIYRSREELHAALLDAIRRADLDAIRQLGDMYRAVTS